MFPVFRELAATEMLPVWVGLTVKELDPEELGFWVRKGLDVIQDSANRVAREVTAHIVHKLGGFKEYVWIHG